VTLLHILNGHRSITYRPTNGIRMDNMPYKQYCVQLGCDIMLSHGNRRTGNILCTFRDDVRQIVVLKETTQRLPAINIRCMERTTSICSRSAFIENSRSVPRNVQPAWTELAYRNDCRLCSDRQFEITVGDRHLVLNVVIAFSADKTVRAQFFTHSGFRQTIYLGLQVRNVFTLTFFSC